MKKANMISWIIGALGALVTVILTFALGPAGTTLGIGLTGSAIAIQKEAMTPQNVSCATIASDYERLKLTQPWPSKEEEKAVLNEFYMALGNAIEHAIKNVTQVKKAIDEEVNYIEGMSGKVQEMNDRSKKITGQDMDLYELLVINDLDEIAKVLDDYIKRHDGGYVFVDYVGRNRNRRGLRSIAQLQMEFARMNKEIEDQLNATEFDRNERFWNLDHAGIQMESMLQIEPFLKFGM